MKINITQDKVIEVEVVKPLVILAGTFCLLEYLTGINKTLGFGAAAFLTVAAFAYSMAILIRTRKVRGWAVAYQLFLFGMLHIYLYYGFGPHHYQCSKEPTWLDWFQFMLAHVLRAADVFDFLEEYKISLQNLHHNSTTSRILLIAMHWMVDILLITWMMKIADVWNEAWTKLSAWAAKEHKKVLLTFLGSWGLGMLLWPFLVVTFCSFPILLFIWFVLSISGIQRWGRNRKASRHKNGSNVASRSLWYFLVVVAVFAYVAIAHSQHWQWGDILWWWPLDNLLRLLDVGDTLQICGWHLHQVPLGYLNATMSVLVRMIASVYIARYLLRIRIVYFKGMGLTYEQLLNNLADAELSQATLDNLHKIMNTQHELIPDVVTAAARHTPESQKIVLEMLPGEIGNDSPEAAKILKPIVKELVDASSQPFLLQALEKLDPNWRHRQVTTDLTSYFLGYLKNYSPIVRQTAANALGSEATAAIPVLKKGIQDPKKEIRLSYVTALGRMEKNAGATLPDIQKLLLDPEAQVRTAAVTAIDSIDHRWIEKPPEQLWRYLNEALQKKDNWFMELFSKRKRWTLRLAAVHVLGEMRMQSAHAKAALQQALQDRNRAVREAAQAALNKVEGVDKGAT